MNETDTPRPTVVVLGGGYAGATAAKALDEVADVTLVDPSDAFVHNVAAWRALVEPEWLDRIFMPYDRLLANGTFLRDRAVAVDGPSVRLESGARLDPDYLVLATGSSYPFPAKSEEPDTETARSRFRDAHAALVGAKRVLLIGAGPAGLELAGEIKAFYPDKQVTIADIAPDILAGPFEQELRDELRRQLDDLGIELKLGSPLRGLPASAPAAAAPVQIATEAGDELTADIWFRCFGIAPETDYLAGSLASARGEDGYVHVDEHLRVAGHPNVFAIGDAADADRNGAGMASAQAKLLAENLTALITGEGEPTAWEAWPPLIAIPLGPEGGAGQLPDGIVGAETIAELKGRAMLVDSYGSLFDAGVGAEAR